ncbi:MAG: DUF1835 domain-containing protein [Pseudomonadota bacterium]
MALPYRANEPFRLNLEQQKKRAKELLRRLKDGDSLARQQFARHSIDLAAPRLTDAQFVVARELGLPSWPKLKAHIEGMEYERRQASVLDAELSTLHVRCGSDIGPRLKEASFGGDFLEYSDALCQGPIIDGEDYLATRARFLTDAYGTHDGNGFGETLQKLGLAEERLTTAVHNYERIVLWMEHDPYDQLVLVRGLSQLAAHGLPRVAELVGINHFPGAMRFIGFGQLPPEALRLLWPQRVRITADQLELASATWTALQASDPSELVQISRSDHPALPHLAPALERYLQELPSSRNGLGLTEQLTLEILSERDCTLGQAFRLLMLEREPLPWLGDLMFRAILEGMARAADPIITITPPTPSSNWHECNLTITPTGRRVVAGGVDWLACGPQERWIGGVHIQPGRPCWRWDTAKRAPVFA